MNQIQNFKKGIFNENPLLVTMLGLCPALAITTKLENALGMGIAFTFVLTLSNFFVSLIKNMVPDELRIPTFIIIIATFVTIIEMLLKAFLPSVSRNLGLFLPLIVVNCIILGRAESFASKNNIITSIIDALGMGIGYTFALSIISIIREILGKGTITVWNDIVLNINTLFNSSQLKIFTSYFLTSAGAYLILGLFFAFIKKIKRGNINEHI